MERADSITIVVCTELGQDLGTQRFPRTWMDARYPVGFVEEVKRQGYSTTAASTRYASAVSIICTVYRYRAPQARRTGRAVMMCKEVEYTAASKPLTIGKLGCIIPDDNSGSSRNTNFVLWFVV